MNRYRNWAFGAAVLLVMVGSLILSSSRTGQAQGKNPQDVLVVNTTSQAIPTVAQGTTSIAGGVSITNTPTVNLASGTNVGINGTPGVEVVNTNTNPVPSVNVNDAREPFQRRLTFNIDPGSTQNQVGFDVPTGKRLVIEHASARVQGPVGQRYIAQLQTHVFSNNSGTGIHWLVLTHQVTVSALDLFTASHDMRVYAEPSTPNTIFAVTRSDISGTAFAELTISGYLVNL